MIALVTGCTDPRAPRATSTDPSGGNETLSPPPAEEQAFGNGSYLNGADYLRGVNIYSLILAGAQDDLSVVGEPESSYAFLASRGIDLVRLAVPWQRLQEIPPGGDAADGLAQPVDMAYLDKVSEEVAEAGRHGIRTVIDLHNGCTYPWGAGDFIEGSLRCGDGITEEHVTTIWRTIAERFRGDQRVAALNIFNEPRWSVGVDNYKRFAQVAVDAIRSTGNDHMIWVEGMLSDTRGRLATIAPDGPWIIDPLDRVMYSEHFYVENSRANFNPDTDYSRVLEQLRTFAEWCRIWAVRCSVGEVGWPAGGEGGAQSAASAEGWNGVFEEFYDIADEYRLDVTYFAASSVNRQGPLLAYVASSPGLPSASGIDSALSQSVVIERHLTRPADDVSSSQSPE